jgi:predicted HNH restriction endonuclease
MPTYLFVTKREKTPERVESGQMWWSCSKTTQRDDRALVYVAGLGIQYEWRALSRAKPHKKWKYMCEVQHVQTFDPPIKINEIRNGVSKDIWAPPYQNFRGLRSINVPHNVAATIRALRPLTASETNGKLFPEEVGRDIALTEGTVRRVLVNAYERNPEARRKCIEHYGTSCYICGFNFGAVYGEVVKDFIHVHHLSPVSEIGGEYVVDPVEDLRPVCPNCHEVLHCRVPAFSIEEVRAFLR